MIVYDYTDHYYENYGHLGVEIILFEFFCQQLFSKMLYILARHTRQEPPQKSVHPLWVFYPPASVAMLPIQSYHDSSFL